MSHDNAIAAADQARLQATLWSLFQGAERLPRPLAAVVGRALIGAVPVVGAPLEVAPGEVVFLWHGAGEGAEVCVAGDWTGWRPDIRLEPLPAVGLHWVQVSLPRDAFVGYKFVVDGQWHFDPANPSRVGAGMGMENSLLTLSRFEMPEVLTGVAPPRGELIELGLIKGRGLGDGRRVRVYLPPGYDDSRPYTTLYVQDGEENISRGKVPDALDHMAQGGYEPLIAVFIDHPGAERHLDYTPYFEHSRLDRYGAFLAEVIVPLIEARYSAAPDRARRVIWGQSFGGTCALGVAHAHPHVFGRVAGQSGVYQWENGVSVAALYQRPPLPDTRVYLDSTHFGMEPTQSEAMARSLTDTRTPHIYWRRGTNHSYEGWRFWLPSMLEALLRPHR